MENRDLWELCCDCKFARRNRGGNPQVCLLAPPRLTEETCEDFTLDLGRMKPRGGGGNWLKVLAGAIGVVSVIFFALVLLVKGFISFLRWIAPPINRGNMDLYLPRSGRAAGRRRR